MRLPDADKLVVERSKIVDYLLNAAHPDNGGKAAFFEGLGFHRADWGTMAAALKALASQAEVMHSIESPHGQKYVIVGPLESPAGKAAQVQAIWIVDKGLNTARLVTAHPSPAAAKAAR